jgi:ornithine cyclodeaminase/alanine dehydrogenase-like protein (mu-crystallin family)
MPLLSRRDVRELLMLHDCIEASERAFRVHTAGRTLEPGERLERDRAPLSEGRATGPTSMIAASALEVVWLFNLPESLLISAGATAGLAILPKR